MREKFTFENPGKNALMAEILARRNRQPRMTFLTSLTAVMAAAISLTAVCGSLPANAIPVEQPSQPEVTEVTEVIAEHSAETPPAEIVTRVHTETKSSLSRNIMSLCSHLQPFHRRMRTSPRTPKQVHHCSVRSSSGISGSSVMRFLPFSSRLKRCTAAVKRQAKSLRYIGEKAIFLSCASLTDICSSRRMF